MDEPDPGIFICCKPWSQGRSISQCHCSMVILQLWLLMRQIYFKLMPGCRTGTSGAKSQNSHAGALQALEPLVFEGRVEEHAASEPLFRNKSILLIQDNTILPPLLDSSFFVGTQHPPSYGTFEDTLIPIPPNDGGVKARMGGTLMGVGADCVASLAPAQKVC